MTREIARLEKLREILQVDHAGYLELAAASSRPHASALHAADYHLGVPNPRHLLTVQELGLSAEDLIVMAMGAADETQLGPLVELFPDLYAEIEDQAAPLRDDGAADRAYSARLDDQLGVL